jgi:hypothetical protein
MLINNPVRTAKKIQYFTITKVNWLKLFKEIIAVYTENEKEHLNAVLGRNADLQNDLCHVVRIITIAF